MMDLVLVWAFSATLALAWLRNFEIECCCGVMHSCAIYNSPQLLLLEY